MRTWMAWSSGKDSAHALAVARRDPGLEVLGLLTTTSEADDTVTHHRVPRALVAAQADALGLPLHEVRVPDPCPNDVYAARMRAALATARAAGVEGVVFGDLFLGDVRAYREARLAEAGLRGCFPLWGRDTHELARTILGVGVVATVVAVDPERLDPCLVGRRYDAAFLDDLPPDVDPCGEHGEFHTFVHDAPGFTRPVPAAFAHSNASQAASSSVSRSLRRRPAAESV